MTSEVRLDEGANSIHNVTKYLGRVFLHVVTLTERPTRIHTHHNIAPLLLLLCLFVVFFLFVVNFKESLLLFVVFLLSSKTVNLHVVCYLHNVVVHLFIYFYCLLVS